jgi:SOS response regulatory protein OraA/RecX
VPRAAPPVSADPDEARKAAHAVALRLLAGREMSGARVRARLHARGFADDVIEETVERLAAAGIIDDRRAARAAARTLVSVRQRGRHRVPRELEQMGFDKELARDTMQEVLADADESAVLTKVVASKLRGRQSINDPAAYRRLFASLLRRGFPADLIRAALRPFWGRRPEPEGD